MAAQRKPSRAGRKIERAGATRAPSVADIEGSNQSGLAARLADRTGITTSGLVIVTLAAVTFAVYGQVWRFEFITLDDPVYASANPHVRSGLTLGGIRWAFSKFYIANWFPLTWLSLMLDGTAYEAWAGGYHLTNLLLHVANVLLVFVVFRKATGQELLSCLRRGVVRRPSPPRRVGRLGHRAQRRFERVLRSADLMGVRQLHTARATLFVLVRPHVLHIQPDVEADARHAALRDVALGLLAPQAAQSTGPLGEDSVPGPLGRFLFRRNARAGQCLDRSLFRGHAAGDAPRERGDCLCVLFAKGDCPLEPGDLLPVFNRLEPARRWHFHLRSWLPSPTSRI